MKRRILSCLLALIMTLSLLPMNALAAQNTGHKIDVRFTVLYVGDEFNIGYNYGSSEQTKFVCQYSTPHSDTAYSNHTIAIRDIKAAADRAIVNSGYQIVGWSKEANANPKTWGFNLKDPTACNKGTTIYLVAKNPNPAQTTYSLIYDKNTTDTVTNMPANQTTTVAADGVQFTVSDLIPVRSGYTFKYWQTSDGTKVGAKVGVTKQNPSVTLYAIWEANAPIDPPTPGDTKPNFADVNGQIRVQCTAYPSNHEPHAYQYDITDGSYTKEGLSSDGSTYSIILDRASFIKKFDADTGRTHKDEEPNEVARVTWRWDVDANNEGKWKLISGPDGITADIKCICEATPEYPPIPGKEENTIGGSGFDFECVTEDATHNKRLQMTLRDHPEAYTVGTEIKTKTDPRGGERAYFEVTVTDVAAYLPTYNYFYGNHKICDGQPNTLTLTFWLLDSGRWGQWGSRTVDPYVKVECVKIPDAPTADVVKKALGNVTVHCINPTTDTQNCTDTVYSAAGGNSVGEAVKVSDTQYTVSIGAAAFANAFGGTRKHNLYSAETLTWVLNYEDGKWVGTPKEAGVDDTILVTHAPEKYQEVSKMGYDLDGNPTGIKATCTTSGHGPITYGLSTAFANYGTDVESVTYDAESKGYIATLKVTHYVESIGTGCNNERAKANLDARDHKLTSDETVQWKLYPTGYDKESGKYVWASMPVADKDAAITVSHKLAVTFMPENGKSDFVNLVYEGETVAEEPVVTRDGYKFLGWYLGEEKFDFTTPITEDITLVAKWEEDKQVVNVVIYRNGDFDKSYDTVSLGKMAKGTIIDLTKLDIADYYTGTSEGYEFHGWYNDGAWNEYKKNPDRAGLSEVTVNGWTNLKCMVYDYETIVVKAVYNNDKDNATELFRGKALHGSKVLGYLNSQNIELDKDGYTHDQWFNWDWYTAWEGDANRIGENTTVNGWTNLYVKYNTIYLDVTFDLNGGNVGGDTSNVVVPVAWGSTVTAPSAVKEAKDRNGYTHKYSLLGWYLDGAAFDLTTPITESITLKAEWRPPYRESLIKSGSFVAHCTTDAEHKDFSGGAVNSFKFVPFGATPELENGVWTIKASFMPKPTLSFNWKKAIQSEWSGITHEWTGEGNYVYLKFAWNPAAEEWYPTEELTYNRTTDNYDTVKVLEDNIFYINTKCVTEPAAPTDAVVQKLAVMGLDSTANNKFVKGGIKLIAGTYTIGEVTGTRKDGFTCVITINDMQKYVDAVNAAKSETYVLDADKTADPFTITLKVAANSTDLSKASWKEDQTGYTRQEQLNGKAFYLTREYTVTFKPENGEADFTQAVIYGKTATKPTNPSKTGYIFAGWYTEDHKVFDFNTAIYGNLTLTAAWTPSGATAFVEDFLTIDCVGCNLGSKLGHAHGAKTYQFLDRAFSVNKDTFQWNEELGTYTVELYNKSLKLNPYLDSIANWVGFDENPGEKLPHQMVGGDRNFYLLCAQTADGKWKAVGYADWKQGGKHDAFTMMENGVTIDVECGTPELPTLVTDTNMIWTRNETNTKQYLKTSVLDGTWTILNDTFKRDEKTGTFYVTIQVAKDQLTKYIDNAAAKGKWGDGYLLNEEKTEGENATPFQFVMKFNLDTSKDASEAYKSTYVKRNKTYSNWSWDKTTVSGSVKNNGYTVWATKEYNVIFETDGGVPVPAPQVVRWGKYATKPTEIPVKGDSWVFNGWYTDETGAVEFDFDKTAIKADTTIYAGYDSVYEIHYFKQLADGSYEEDTASFVRGFAKEGTVINAPEKDYGTHFLLNTEKSNMSGPVIKATVDNEGKVNCLVLNVYYDRDMHTVTFDTQDGTKIDPVEVRCGNPVAQPITPSKAGYYFSGWFLNGSKYDFSTSVTSDITITAKFTKYAPVNPVPPTVEAKDLAFNTTDHFAYVNGYPDGTVQPEGNITRAEVAAILYRVMDAKCVEKYATDKNTFVDVDAFKWYNTYISTLANAGVIVDSANGYFRPNEAITRAELAAMIAQFAKVDLTKSVSFNDVLANHWASKEIAIAAKMGWINGYPDGSFRPDATITRAEMITMINRALNRVPSAEDHLLAEMVTFPDCQSGQWYYLAVQEATNGHTYNRVGTAGDERWIALIK